MGRGGQVSLLSYRSSLFFIHYSPLSCRVCLCIDSFDNAIPCNRKQSLRTNPESQAATAIACVLTVALASTASAALHPQALCQKHPGCKLYIHPGCVLLVFGTSAKHLR